MSTLRDFLDYVHVFDLLVTLGHSCWEMADWSFSLFFSDVKEVAQFLGIQGFVLVSICAFVLLVVCLPRRHRKTLAAFSSVFSRICYFSTGVEGRPLLPESMAWKPRKRLEHFKDMRCGKSAAVWFAVCMPSILFMSALCSYHVLIDFPFFSCDPPKISELNIGKVRLLLNGWLRC